MTTVTLPSGKFLIVDVLEGASDFNMAFVDEGLNFNTPSKYVEGGTQGNSILFPAHLANMAGYTIIGVDPLNLTEDEWKGIVDTVSGWSSVIYRNYDASGRDYRDIVESAFHTATESGSSLLTANGHKQGSAVILKVND
jgi:hypothetical protein